MKTQLLSLIIFFVSLECSFAQSLTPFVISSSGGFYSNATGMLSITTGEMTMVKTFTGSVNILTQGFQQPDGLQVAVPENESEESEISIFPNPASATLNVSISSGYDKKYIITLYDVIGQKVLSCTYIPAYNKAVYEIDISNLETGMYIFQIATENALAKTVRINKI